MGLDEVLMLGKTGSPSTAHEKGFMMPSASLCRLMDNVFGPDNRNVIGKSVGDILGLLKKVVDPLPTLEDLDKSMRKIPGIFVTSQSPRKVEASFNNFKVTDDGDINFEIFVHDQNFQVDKRSLDECVTAVLKLALSDCLSNDDFYSNESLVIIPNQFLN